MNSLNDFEKTKNSILNNIEAMQKNLSALNEVIMGEAKGIEHQTVHLTGIFENFNTEKYYGNKTVNSKVEFMLPVVRKMFCNNPILRMNFLTTYRSQLNEEIRKEQIRLDKHHQEAINYLNQVK